MKKNKVFKFFICFCLAFVSLSFYGCSRVEGFYKYVSTEIEISPGLSNSELQALYDEYSAKDHEQLLKNIKTKKTALAKVKEYNKIQLTFKNEGVLSVFYKSKTLKGKWTKESDSEKIKIVQENDIRFPFATEFHISTKNKIYFKESGIDGIIVSHYYQK